MANPSFPFMIKTCSLYMLISLFFTMANYAHSADNPEDGTGENANPTAEAQAPNETPSLETQTSNETTPRIGQWIKRGDPFKEAPVCYQLWKCVVPATDDAPAKESIPEGTWGLCDDFLNVNKNGQACNTCNASHPQTTCQ